MAEGGLEAVRADEDVVAASRVRELEAKVRELERLLGRKTMEAEILREALEQARPKNTRCAYRQRSALLGGERASAGNWRSECYPDRTVSARWAERAHFARTSFPWW